ncbi:unnamed protein product, partial [Prorocentrum cordatum]
EFVAQAKAAAKAALTAAAESFKASQAEVEFMDRVKKKRLPWPKFQLNQQEVLPPGSASRAASAAYLEGSQQAQPGTEDLGATAAARGAGRGGGAASSQQALHLHAEPVYLGTEAQEEIDALAGDVAIFPEARVGADGANDILEHLEFNGWTAVASPSRARQGSELAGGIGLAARAHLSVTSLRYVAAKKGQMVRLRVLDKKEWSPGPIGFQDMVAVNWRWMGQSILVVGMRLTSSVGVRSKVNLSKLARLAAIARCHGGPWAETGDWNSESRELQQAGWLGMLGATIRTLGDVDRTCTRSPSRMMGCVVCSRSFCAALDKVDSDQRGLELAQPFSLPGLPKKKADPSGKRSGQKANNHVGGFERGSARCAELPNECMVRNEMEDLFGECESSIEDGEVSEDSACEEAKAKPRKSEEVFDFESAARLFDEAAAKDLGAQCGAWMRACEHCFVAIVQVHPDKWRNYCSRGVGIHVVNVSAKLSADVPADGGQSIRCWGTLASYSLELQRCKKGKARWREVLRNVGGVREEQLQGLGVAALATAKKGKAPRQWRKKWASHFRRETIFEKLDITGEAATDEGGAIVAIEDFNNAIESMAKSKAKGIEQMGALACKRLPPGAWGGLRKLIEEVERMGAWPRQLMLALVSLLRKDAGGDRAIGSLPEVVKLWSKMRSECTIEWVAHMAGEWGAAVSGNSALQEALVRSFADEALEWAPMQVCAVTALPGPREFCDTLEPVLILKEGLRLGIPARALHLEMLSHSGTSICAGARRGVDFGGVALSVVLEKVSAKCEQICARSWVGDVATRMKDSRGGVVRQLSNAGVEFAAGAKKARLTSSTESALIGNDMGVVNEVALKLHSRNITVNVRSQAPDPGIDRGRGGVAGGKGKRAERAAHADRQVSGRCLTALLQVEIAKRGPAFGAAFALLDYWMHVIRGGKRAMVNALLDLDWGPKGPWHWVSGADEEFGGSDPTGLDGDLDISDLKQALSDAIERRQWTAAADHNAGKGLKEGADLLSARALIRKLEAKGECDEVGAQLALFTGGVWPWQRVADLGIEVEGVMRPRCGEDPDTWVRRMRGYKCNEIIE